MSNCETATAANQDPAVTAFVAAVRRGDAPGVRELIRRHPALTAHLNDPLFDFDGPSVMFCAGRGDRATIDVLLDAGADINAKSKWWAGGFGPLHVCKGELAQHLIARGAKLDAHAAAHQGMLDELRRIVDANPSVVHERGGDGQTPLHFAATPEIAAFLLDRGADLNARDIDHASTPAQWAVHGRPDVVRFLLSRGAEPDVFMACAIGEADLVRRMLAADPTLAHAKVTPERFPAAPPAAGHIYLFTIGTGATPLHAAAQAGWAEVAALLLDAGADVNAPGGYDDATPLHSAAWHERPDVARLLLDRGADIDRRSGRLHRNTPLGWAIVAGSLGMVELLLGRGAPIHPWFMDNALAAVRGEFNGISRAPAENRSRILGLVRERA